MIQTVTKQVEVPQIQYEDEVVEVPIQKQVHVPVVQKVQKTVKVPQVQYEDQIVQVPIQTQVQVPIVQKVQKTVKVPQIQYEDQGFIKVLSRYFWFYKVFEDCIMSYTGLCL
ncbi:unnamed protein product [Symbiodinium sp. KB8]|nr:unnamed protein product [Symbiodinium sp. KB8]